MKLFYYILITVIVFIFWFVYSDQNKIIDHKNLVISQKNITISWFQQSDNDVIKLYKKELNLWLEKQKILDGLPFVNTQLYIEWKLEIKSIREIDDKILEVRSERLLLEKKMFPYKVGLDIQ